MKASKRYKEAERWVERDKVYSLLEAISILKKMPHCKFDETVELSFTLGVDPKKSDQAVRSSCVLPHGSGKKIRVLVFAKGDKEREAKEAGADYAGLEEYIKKIEEGWFEFDYCIASPEVMRDIGKLGKILGPRGLMPSSKTGSVTTNIALAVKQVKEGKVDFRMDKFGVVHAGIGKLSFEPQKLLENARAFIGALLSAKPPSAKGMFIKNCFLSSTMSPALKIDWQSEAKNLG